MDAEGLRLEAATPRLRGGSGAEGAPGRVAGGALSTWPFPDSEGDPSHPSVGGRSEGGNAILAHEPQQGSQHSPAPGPEQRWHNACGVALAKC